MHTPITPDTAHLAADAAPHTVDPASRGVDPVPPSVDPAARGVDPAARGADPAVPGVDPAVSGVDPAPRGVDTRALPDGASRVGSVGVGSAGGRWRWRRGPAQGTAGTWRAPACTQCARRAVEPPDVDRPEVTSPQAAADLVVGELADADRERCLALLLDTKHRLLDLVTVSVGSVDHTFMAPREIYRDALLANAAALVVAHNHPSGDPEPSSDDERLTRRLARAGELVGVELLDHLVAGGLRWVSLARRGIL